MATTSAPANWGAHIPGPRDPLPSEFEQFLAWLKIERNRPDTTVRAYRQDLAKFIAFLATQVDLRSPDLLEGLDRAVLRRYQIELAAVVPNPRTRARVLGTLRTFLGFAYDEGWTTKELGRQVTLPRFVMGDPHPIPTKDVNRLLKALPKSNLRELRDRAMVFFLFSTGCRIAEALALDRTDIRREGFRVLGKGGKHRTVYLTDAAYAAVQDYLQSRGPDPAPALFISMAYKDMPGGVPLLHNRLTSDGSRRAITMLRERMANRKLVELFSRLRSPHVARHTAATTLLEATDGDVRLVQEVLGHATLETLRIYTEITDRRKRDAYKRLAAYLNGVSARTEKARR